MSLPRTAAWVLGVVLLVAAVGCEGQDTATTSDGVFLGAKIEDVEKKLGPPVSVLPNMGAELRSYKAASGRRYVLTVEDGKVIEIH
jgi:hypothetical protein